MLREYPCPSCGFTINSWAQHQRCPRCSALLPAHDVSLPMPQSSEQVVEQEVDFFQRRGAALQPEEEYEAPVPWYGQPVVLVGLATVLAILLFGVAVWLVLDGGLP